MSSPGGGLLTVAQLASIQAAAVIALDKLCVIQRPARVPDGLGGYTETDPVVAIVACNVTPPTGAMEVAMASRITAVASYHVNFPANTDVRPQDRLLIGGQPAPVYGAGAYGVGPYGNVHVLTVGTVYQPHSYGVFVQVFASEVL